MPASTQGRDCLARWARTSGCTGSAALCATTLPPLSTIWNCTLPSARRKTLRSARSALCPRQSPF